MKKKYIKRIIISTIAASVIGLTSFKIHDDGDDFELIKNLEIFHTLIKNLRILYVDEISSADIIKNAIDKMLETLDPYTVYYPESLVEDVKFINSGEYAGIGAEIEIINKQPVICDITQNSPADKNGVFIGDIIKSIDDKPTTNKTLDEINLMIKGEPGISTKLQLIRNQQTITKNINRVIIKTKSIPYYGIVADKIGYINLASFTENCSAEFKEALTKLKNEQKIEKLIIDLRYNPGGLLIEAVNIVNLFVNKGENIVEMKGKVEQWNKNFKAENNPIDTKIPIIVLVNRQSASAAEIVSGALQDLDRAVIIGEKTFGKGLVQTTKDLIYNAKCKITTAKYYIPSGRCIQKLDYSHKNQLGKAQIVPDSLIKTFKTSNGRPVKDAGGIMPDIEVKKDTLSYLVENMIDKNIIFNYAAQYHIKNATIPTPEEFKISQQQINEIKTIAGSNINNYQTITENQIKALEKAAESDFHSKEIQKQIELLKQQINEIKKTEINKYDNQIQKAAEAEIVRHYYYEEGEIRYTLKNDPYISTAIETLNNAILYKNTLKIK